MEICENVLAGGTRRSRANERWLTQNRAKFSRCGRQVKMASRKRRRCSTTMLTPSLEKGARFRRMVHHDIGTGGTKEEHSIPLQQSKEIAWQQLFDINGSRRPPHSTCSVIEHIWECTRATGQRQIRVHIGGLTKKLERPNLLFMYFDGTEWRPWVAYIGSSNTFLCNANELVLENWDEEFMTLDELAVLRHSGRRASIGGLPPNYRPRACGARPSSAATPPFILISRQAATLRSAR